MPKDMSLEDMRAMRPGRSAELERLDMLAGDWTTEGTVEFITAREPIHTTGENHSAWECDGRFLVERASFDMGALGPMTGISIWTWDAGARRYRMWWFDSFGESASGTARFDDRAMTWHIKTRGQNGFCRVRSRGTIRQIDCDTLEWTWRQNAFMGLFKIADMKGVSRRKR